MARGEAYKGFVRFPDGGFAMFPLIANLAQTELLHSDKLDELLKVWHSSHLYDPNSLGELLEEVVE